MGNTQSSYPTFYDADPDGVAIVHALTGYTDLSSKSVGGAIVKVSDEKFGLARNLIKGSHHPNPRFDPKHADKKLLFNHDAWVTQRHNKDHDWVIIKLGNTGTIAGFGIDTTNLLYDYAPRISIEACLVPEEMQKRYKNNPDDFPFIWDILIPETDVHPNKLSKLALWNETKTVYNFVKVNIYPDGGLTRFHVYGKVALLEEPTSMIDLASAVNGGVVVSSSDESLCRAENLNLPGNSTADENLGWVTRRKPSRNFKESDWAIIKLSDPGYLKKAVIDTTHIDGSQPVSASLLACYSINADPALDRSCAWYEICGNTQIEPNKQHSVDLSLPNEMFSHVKLVIHPDGGIARLRIYGEYENTSEPDSETEQDQETSETEQELKSPVAQEKSPNKISTDVELPEKTSLKASPDDLSPTKTPTQPDQVTRTRKRTVGSFTDDIKSSVAGAIKEAKETNYFDDKQSQKIDMEIENRPIAKPRKPSSKKPLMIHSPGPISSPKNKGSKSTFNDINSPVNKSPFDFEDDDEEEKHQGKKSKGSQKKQSTESIQKHQPQNGQKQKKKSKKQKPVSVTQN
ncbi:hypothetical protein BB559_000113 [Furculomyces boomerangus]|uniref:Allantoicase domain-containing protein n=2 Tax=Harpellales TaxID=61421 RepID=A0A2T9YD46_9FUNG|nr:hypothetical protein BB559_004701 [Furculomyces boomerangus]PVV00101.1 hypothetical protein BB559_000113 [Furculomyces boomerangus]PWA00585.1 hypothetical protein BB558_003367 [Smittium angustum]